MKIILKNRSKTKFTRMCIGEAIMELLKTTEYEKLRVSHIVRKAGVARMSFYKHYGSVYEALTDYLDTIISEYMEEYEEKENSDIYMKYEHILYSLNFFDRYAEQFLILAKNNLYSIMIDGINGFMEKHIETNENITKYQLYSYAGGLLNSFIKWEENGKQESAEELARTIMQLYCRGNE